MDDDDDDDDMLFLSKMLSLKNDVVQICFNCFNSSSECCALCYDYDINASRCSAVAIKEKVCYEFRMSVDLVPLFYFFIFLIVLYVSVCHVHCSLPSWRINFIINASKMQTVH